MSHKKKKGPEAVVREIKRKTSPQFINNILNNLIKFINHCV